MPIRIDSHQHFWKYTAAEYGWIDDSMSALRRDFLPEDLHKEMRHAGLDGAISVQARQTVAETEWLLALAERHAFLQGVVGWVELISPRVEVFIEKYSAHKRLRAVRHLLQDETDDRYILRKDFNEGISVLEKYGLAYDILIFERHLPQTVEFVDRHPKQRFVLDHIAKPRIRDGVMSPWRENMRELAKRPNVWCKVSGVVTEADHKRWTEAQVRPYIETAIDAFGPKRILFGSDWPVCLAATTYSNWIAVVRAVVSKLSRSEQDWIFGGAATQAYKL